MNDFTIGALLVSHAVVLLFLSDGRLIKELWRSLYTAAEDAQKVFDILLRELFLLLSFFGFENVHLVSAEIVRDKVLQTLRHQ